MVKINTRHYLNTVHLQAAQRSADRAKEFEAQYTPPVQGLVFHEHRGYVMQAIVGTVAFLEATINQLFADAEEGHADSLKGIDPATVGLMGSMWREGIPRTARYPVLNKYDVALALAQKPAFEKGAAPYQAAKLTVDLRNALIHYEPEWIPSDVSITDIERHQFDKALRGKFALNPFVSEGNPFYPDKCLSAGCAQWAIEAGLAFVNDFHKRIGKTK